MALLPRKARTTTGDDVMKLTYEAFDRALDRLAPGVTMGELIEAGTITGLGGRAKSGVGLHGRGTGDDGPLLVAGRMPAKEILDQWDQTLPLFKKVMPRDYRRVLEERKRWEENREPEAVRHG